MTNFTANQSTLKLAKICLNSGTDSRQSSSLPIKRRKWQNRRYLHSSKSDLNNLFVKMFRKITFIVISSLISLSLYNCSSEGDSPVKFNTQPFAYVTSTDKSLYAFNGTTGAMLWSFAASDSIFSDPLVYNGTVYIASLDSNVYALNALTGVIRWQFKTSSPLKTNIAVNNVQRLLHFASYDSLYTLDAFSGVKLWSKSFNNRNYTCPVTNDSLVFIGGKDNILYAFNAKNGNKIWSREQTIISPSTSLNLSGNLIYLSSSDHNVYALDTLNGTQKWKFTTGGSVNSTPVVQSGILYIGSTDKNVYAIDAKTGNKKWSFPLGDVTYSSPTIANGIVYIGCNDRNIYALNASTGEKVWTFQAEGPIVSSPTVSDDLLYFGSIDKGLYVLDAKTGKRIWSYFTLSRILSSPSVIDKNGKVHNFKNSDLSLPL